MINEGKFFAKRQDDFVVFMLGMRIHNLWNIKKWTSLYRIIPKMLQELEQSEGLGYLGSISKVSFREPLIIQYWNSVEELHEFARTPEQTHLEVWKTFNRMVGKSKDIGIWHETYTVQPNTHENIYVNMPFQGIGQFTPLQSIDKKFRNYKKRF